MTYRQSVAVLRCVVLFGLVCLISYQCFAGSTSEISYQGLLEDSSGNPITGMYVMQFSIWDSMTGGTKSWPSTAVSENHSLVQITDGIFSVLLGSEGYPLTADVFDGSDRYLEIQICNVPGPACILFETLSPRQKLTGSGYSQKAVGFVPGIVMSHNGNVMSLTSTSGSGSAISGYASNSGGSGAGIYGEAGAPASAGVAGYNTSSGYGVYGSSTDGYGVYSNGDAHVEGDVSFKAKTEYYWLTPAEFVPLYSESLRYTNYNLSLTSIGPLARVAYAQVHLPNGARLVKMTGYWFDTSTSYDGTIELARTVIHNTPNVIATAVSIPVSTGESSAETTNFNGYEIVDNENQGLVVYAWLSDNGMTESVSLNSVKIEYTYTQP